MAEPGEVTRALLAIARDLCDDRTLAEQICRACAAGLDIDGAINEAWVAGEITDRGEHATGAELVGDYA